MIYVFPVTFPTGVILILILIQAPPAAESTFVYCAIARMVRLRVTSAVEPASWAREWSACQRWQRLRAQQHRSSGSNAKREHIGGRFIDSALSGKGQAMRARNHYSTCMEAMPRPQEICSHPCSITYYKP